MDNRLELLIDAKAMLGEGPWWDAEEKILYWIDGLGGKVHKYNYITKENKTMDVGQYVGCIIPDSDSNLIGCLQHGIYSIDIESNKMTLINDIEADINNNRLNDGKCDSLGRLWFGSMSMTANQADREFEITGSFYCYDESRGKKVKKMFGNVGISNGLSWNKEETIMYYIDSITGKVVSFDFNKEQGIIENKKIVVEIPEKDGIPDGMTIDEEGKLWIAHFGGYQVSRWDPYTGKKIDMIKLPVANVTSCVFGGENMDELYITTAKTGLSKKELSRQPLAGGLFKAKARVKGLQLHKFTREVN